MAETEPGSPGQDTSTSTIKPRPSRRWRRQAQSLRPEGQEWHYSYTRLTHQDSNWVVGYPQYSMEYATLDPSVKGNQSTSPHGCFFHHLSMLFTSSILNVTSLSRFNTKETQKQ